MKRSIKIIIMLMAMVMLFSVASPVTALAATKSAKPASTTISSVTASDNGFTVKWKKVKNVTGYKIQYSTASSFKNAKTVTVNKAGTTSKKVTGLKSKKKYYVRVRTYKTVKKKNTYSSYTKSKAVTTGVAKTTVSKITAKQKGFTVQWKKVSDITGYQIQYSTDSKFKKNNKTVKITKASTTSKTINGLKDNQKYYVRIRAYKTANKKTYYSSYTATKNVTTNPPVTSISEITLQQGNDINISWTEVSGITGYQIQYSTDSAFKNDNKTQKITDSSVTSAVLSNLAENQIYYVRIRTFVTVGDKNTYSSWSDISKQATTAHTHNWKAVYKTEDVYETKKTLVAPAYDETIYRNNGKEYQALYCGGCNKELRQMAYDYNMDFMNFHLAHNGLQPVSGIPLCPRNTGRSESEMNITYSGDYMGGKPNFVKIIDHVEHHDAVYEDKKVKTGTKQVLVYECSCGATQPA